MDEARRRRRLTLLLGPIACLVVASNVGSALAPTLVHEHPLVLLALDARIRHVVLVSGLVDPVPYYLVGTLRLLLADPLFYLLGYWYGEPALQWVEQRSGTVGRFLRSVEGFFGKATYPLVFLAPNNYICLFAGASRMHPGVFLALNASGTVGRLALVRYVGDAFAEPRADLLGLIREYQLPLTIAAVVLVGGQALLERRRGRDEITALVELEEELEEEIGRDEAVENEERG